MTKDEQIVALREELESIRDWADRDDSVDPKELRNLVSDIDTVLESTEED